MEAESAISYGVTGTVELSPDRIAFVHEVIRDLPDLKWLVTGGAFGVDTEAAYAGFLYHPEASRFILTPDGMKYNKDTHNYGEVFPISGGYMKRNDAIVEHSDVLVAFPKTDEEELRSGTWATIRRARKAGVPVLLNPLDVCYTDSMSETKESVPKRQPPPNDQWCVGCNPDNCCGCGPIYHDPKESR